MFYFGAFFRYLLMTTASGQWMSLKQTSLQVSSLLWAHIFVWSYCPVCCKMAEETPNMMGARWLTSFTHFRSRCVCVSADCYGFSRVIHSLSRSGCGFPVPWRESAGQCLHGLQRLHLCLWTDRWDVYNHSQLYLVHPNTFLPPTDC